jgi:hypothetical protein
MMALLDLQGMDTAPQGDGHGGGGSGSSGGSCPSNLSLTLCGKSGLSLLLCD